MHYLAIPLSHCLMATSWNDVEVKPHALQTSALDVGECPVLLATILSPFPIK